jgi:flagellar biosynthesis/type III secretory pathway protein FliH
MGLFNKIFSRDNKDEINDDYFVEENSSSEEIFENGYEGGYEDGYEDGHEDGYDEGQYNAYGRTLRLEGSSEAGRRLAEKRWHHKK